MRSGIGIRSVATGFALERPEDEQLASVFEGICNGHDVLVAEGEQILLKIPQELSGGDLVDSVDRVQVGTALLREFVEGGL